MRIVLIFLAIFFSSGSFALDPGVRLSLENTFAFLHVSQFKADFPSKPIRTALGKFRVEKYTLVTEADGSEHFLVSEVCSKQAPVNVYDARGTGGGPNQADYSVVSCDSQYLGKKITIVIGSPVVIAAGDLYGSTMQDFKGAFPILSFSASTPAPNVPPLVSNFAGTSQLDSHASLLSLMHPAQMGTCDPRGKCTHLKESFGATVEIFD